jgi:ubiquinol-cytochrome c reductase cytochrome c1 subunit
MRRTLLVIAAFVGLTAAPAAALAAEGEQHMEHLHWSFDGPFGHFDQAQLQRGYKVYSEVCSSCHSMDMLSFRNLGEKYGPFWDPQWPNPNDNEYVKQIAREHEIDDIDSETGEALPRPGITADGFPDPYPNEAAARGGNGGALPPDLSVIVKARHGGADYVYSLLTGYAAAPAGTDVPTGMHYNLTMPGNMVAMAPPLEVDKVAFDDGTASTVEQQAKDVAAFLAWASEPKQIERKRTGFWVMIYLVLLAGVVYASYRKVWRNESH